MWYKLKADGSVPAETKFVSSKQSVSLQSNQKTANEL